MFLNLVCIVSLLIFFLKPIQTATVPCSVRDFGNGGIVCVCNSTYCDTVEPNIKLPPGGIAQYVTSENQTLSKTVVHFNNQSKADIVFTIDRSTTYQTIQGFGGAFTDAAGINILSLPESAQEKLLRSYYSHEGIEYTVGRIPMASCDFSTHPYSYDDTPSDFDLVHFALAPEDLKYKIPVIQRAIAINKRNISIFGSPWSAPAWMKTNKNMTGKGQLIGQPGGKYFKTWANYFVRFLQEYEKHNITLWGLTAQNEPTDGEIDRFYFQCMGWTPEMQRDFIAKDLGPALHSNGYSDIKLMMLDDQRVLIAKWSDKVLQDAAAAKYVSGIALHWYLDAFVSADAMDVMHAKFPDKFIFGSEACTGEWPWQHNVLLGSLNRAIFYVHDIIQVFSNLDNLKYVSGIGVHWYWDFITPLSILDKTHDTFPTKFILATEACEGSQPWQFRKVILGSWERAANYAHSIIQDLNHWVTGWTDWNIALDMQGGPNWVNNFVDSPVIVNAKMGEFYKQPMFYAMGHFSKFVIPGAKRVKLVQSSIRKNLFSVAFLLPDKSIVLTILNEDYISFPITFVDKKLGSHTTVVAGRSITTWIWWNT